MGVWLKRIARWTLLVLGSVFLFVLVIDRFYPIALTPTRHVSRVVTGEEGDWLYAVTDQDGRWRFTADLRRIDPLYLRMLRVVEDQRFDYHPGIDPLSMARALGQWIASGHIRSGGSTITMQLARLLEPKPRTLRSKVLEMIRALQLELHHSKATILSAYLTLTPYGGNVEGIVAASRRYFGKLPTNLSPAEAALLVALPRNPEQLRPDRHPRRARAARDRVLRKALQHGLITRVIYAQALAAPIPRKRHPFPRHAPHIAPRLLRKAPAFQTTIATTLQTPLQTQLEAWARIAGMRLPAGATLAVLVIRNRDGAVEAYLGSHDMFSPRTAGYVDMIRAVRSPGSTLKPFVYAMAFEIHRVHPNTIIRDRETRFGDYLPHNYSRRYTGDVTVAYALEHSLNIPAVKLLAQVGAPAFVARLGRVAGKLHIPRGTPTLPVILGGLGITPWQIAQLYVGLAHGGEAPRLHLTPQEVEDNTTTLCDPESARMVTAILRRIAPPTGHIDPLRRIAFKTGTSYGTRDLWTAAYTRDHTVVVWIGRPDNAPMPRHSGREIAAPLAFDVLEILQSLLPDRVWDWSPDYLGSTTPQALRTFDRTVRVSTPTMHFIRPAQDARFRSAGCYDATVPATIDGGTPPYTWYIDDTQTPGTAPRRDIPLGTGAHTITVIDQKGETISRDVWVEAGECEEDGVLVPRY